MLQSRPFSRKAKGGSPMSRRSESSVQRQTLLRTQTEQQQLPYELWLHIFSYVEDRNDIVNLCRCSGTLREIAEVYLYRNLNINFSAVNGGARRALMLLEAIRNPRFSSVTTEIRVNFQSCRQRIDTARGETSPKKCKCGAIDDMFGVALQSMRVLEVLSIECHFCMNLSTGRHHYLTNLATKNLRQLRYECHCSMGNSFDPAALLSAPWMRSVTALNWPPSLWTSIPPITLRGLMKTDGFLPNIDTLNYAGPGLYDELLTKRTIRRLSSLVIDPSPPLDNHPNRRLITHLSINEYCLNTLLTGVMGIGQFGNLQHLGTLPFSQGFSNTNNDVFQTINSALVRISDLKKLVSIDACMRLYKPQEDPVDQQLLIRLETVHPRLRKVFFSGNRTYVWILGDLGTWEKRSLPEYSSWDLISGKYDNL